MEKKEKGKNEEEKEGKKEEGKKGCVTNGRGRKGRKEGGYEVYGEER